MRNRAIIGRGVGAASLAAALGCLQPGIDPIYLTVLSDARPVPLEAHGLVVGFTQAGSALGALTVWWLGPVLPRGSVLAAAVLAFLCSVATALAGSLATVLACRAGYGLAMGWSMPPPWRPMPRRPSKAYGAVYLTQLILSTLVSLALPELMLAAARKPR
jgi:MFS family permease